MILRYAICIFSLLTACFVHAGSSTRFASIFSDNLVLQQQADICLWGYANPNEKLMLKCSWLNSGIHLVSSENGTWKVSVHTPEGNFMPQSVSLSNSKGETVALSNVLIGEVWLCSGQSNMEMILKSQPEWNLLVEHSEEEIALADFPNIHFVNIQRKESFVPLDDSANYGWKVCTPNDVKWLSAVAYFFGKKLFKELNVPVGLIVSAYGGSPIQSWIPEEVVKSGRLYEAERSKRDAEVLASSRSEVEYVKAMSDWISEAEKTGSSMCYGKTEYLDLPVDLEKSRIGNQFGELSFSKEIEISPNEAGQDLHFNLGMINDFGRIYLNGELVWEELCNSRSYAQVRFDVPAEKVQSVKILIEVRVLNVLWGGGLTGPPENMFYTVGNNAEKKTLIGTWQYKKIFDLADVKSVPCEGKPLFSTLSALYNGMIHPLVNYSVKGCLWYQGEENVGDAKRYPEMFIEMIASWRKAFHHDFPFYYVQIAPYRYGGKQSMKSPELREAQGLIEKAVPNTGMVVTMDLGNPENIHPAKKQEVGSRLANMALAKTYQKNMPYLYPTLVTAQSKGDSVVLTFTNVYNGLIPTGEKHLFELSFDGKEYLPVDVRISGNCIVLHSEKVTDPRYVRYCWRDASIGTIFNSEGLPLSSFRTVVSTLETNQASIKTKNN